jgi:pyridoxal phosphate enzyme (YggS family)
MSIKQNIRNIKIVIPENVKLVAVSKTYSIDKIMEAYQEGQRIFGENKVQELIIKKEQLPTDIKWHFIGHLQSNKVKQIAPFVDLIHGVDSVKLIEVINKEAKDANQIVNCLLQIHIAEETTKFGFTEKEIYDFLSSVAIKEYENINICGLMGMATYTNDNKQVRIEFQSLKKIFNRVKSDFFLNNTFFKEISMGMSDDYEIAIEEGSTIIRVGSAIFGQRNYE